MIWHTIFAFFISPTFASCVDQLVLHPVVGLYESIPSKKKFQVDDLHFITSVSTSRRRDKVASVYTRIVNPAGETIATAERSFSPDRLEMRLDYVMTLDTFDVQRSAPSFISMPGVIPLVAGRGVPTSVFLTLHQMRVAKVNYASIHTMSTERITNPVTTLELANRPAVREWLRTHDTFPKDIIEQEIMRTSTGRYIQTTLTQAGLRIEDLFITEGSLIEVDHEMYLGSHASIRQARGLVKAGDIVPSGYRIVLSLAPL